MKSCVLYCVLVLASCAPLPGQPEPGLSTAAINLVSLAQQSSWQGWLAPTAQTNSLFIPDVSHGANAGDQQTVNLGRSLHRQHQGVF